MAKTTGPLFSCAAHGTIAKKITFSARKNHQLTRWQEKNRDANSSAQNTERGIFLSARDNWAALSDAERDLWTDWNNG